MKPYRTVIDVRNTTQDLTTISSVKLDLGLDPLDLSHDDWINAQIKQASNHIASLCNRVFGTETLSDYFKADHTFYGSFYGPLELSRMPVTEIASVDEAGTGLSAADFEVDEETGLLWRLLPYSNYYSRCNWFSGPIHVQFKAGYDLLGTLPYDLERAANILVKGSYYAKTRDPSIRSETIPGVMAFDYGSGAGVKLDSSTSAEIARLVAPYKLVQYG